MMAVQGHCDMTYRRSRLDNEKKKSNLNQVVAGDSDRRVVKSRSKLTSRSRKIFLFLLLVPVITLWGLNLMVMDPESSPDASSQRHKICRRTWYGRWKCRDCGSDGKSCRVLSPKGLCPPFYRQEWDSPPRRSSLYNPASNTEVSHSLVTSYGVRKKIRRTYDLASCSVAIPSCFNLTKCHHLIDNSQSLLRVYAGDKNESSKATEYVNRAAKKDVIVRVYDPSEACLIVITNDLYETPQSLSTRETWNDGQNHFVWDVQGDAPFKKVGTFGMAATSCGAFTNAQIRLGYDMSIALRSKWKRPTQYSDLDIHRPRRLLLSFKGSVMDSFMPYYQHRWLAAEYWDTTDRDVVVDVQCKYRGLLGGPLNRFYFPKHYDDSDPASYGELLLNSTFGFAPGGSGASSFRFTEILSADGIPVVLPEMVPPFSPEIDWSDCVVRISEERIVDLPRILREMPANEVRKRQRVCSTLYKTILHDDVYGQFEVAMKIWKIRVKNALQLKLETSKILGIAEPESRC